MRRFKNFLGRARKHKSRESRWRNPAAFVFLGLTLRQDMFAGCGEAIEAPAGTFEAVAGVSGADLARVDEGVHAIRAPLVVGPLFAFQDDLGGAARGFIAKDGAIEALLMVDAFPVVLPIPSEEDGSFGITDDHRSTRRKELTVTDALAGVMGIGEGGHFRIELRGDDQAIGKGEHHRVWEYTRFSRGGCPLEDVQRGVGFRGATVCHFSFPGRLFLLKGRPFLMW